ncbi:hypothetical protein JB92DRAFT_3117029 [Gautieria morchelliformis]|nr:hypothetical protein JB92DRAFT_3117029 [Gautieria morchelliformis]
MYAANNGGVPAPYATPYYAAVDHVQHDAPVDPQACLSEYTPEQLVGNVSVGTSVTPDWIGNAGKPSENAPLLTADGFVPQVLPCVAGGSVAHAEFQPGTSGVAWNMFQSDGTCAMPQWTGAHNMVCRRRTPGKLISGDIRGRRAGSLSTTKI